MENRRTYVSLFSIFIIIIAVDLATTKECIKTLVGVPCTQDSECRAMNELHLYCNKSKGANVCTFGVATYIGHAATDVDCEGLEYSAEPWSNPIPEGLVSIGNDCMRMCLHVSTCFGMGLYNRQCYLKNDKCFGNLKRREGAKIAVLNVVREDYKCGCHYPFTRMKSNGEALVWNPECPESQLSQNPYRCCSERGLCTECGQKGNETGAKGLMGDFLLR